MSKSDNIIPAWQRELMHLRRLGYDRFRIDGDMSGDGLFTWELTMWRNEEYIADINSGFKPLLESAVLKCVYLAVQKHGHPNNLPHEEGDK